MRHFDGTFEVVEGLVYYNFAAGSFLSKKLCSRLHSIEAFIPKSSLSEPPLGRLRRNVRTSSIARSKARVRLRPTFRHN